MTDSSMTDILKNFNNAEAGKGEVIDATTGKIKISDAASQNNAMKILLEGLDAAQASVNQMPGTHKMAKNTATKHPAGNFLVGGAEGEPDAGQEVVAEDEYEFRDGMSVELTSDYADKPGEVFTLSQWDGRNGWIEDESGQGWRVSASKIMPASEDDAWNIDDHFYEADKEDDYVDEPNADELDHRWDQENMTGTVTAKLKDVMQDEEPLEEGELRSVKVTFSDGNTMTTDMAANLSDKEMLDYYKVGKRFNMGDGAGGDNIVSVTNAEVLDSARDKRRQQALGHQSMGSVDLDNQNRDLRDDVIPEAKSDNFTADDLQKLSSITDLAQLKGVAIDLVSNTDSTRPMKPEKVSWFKRQIEKKTNTNAIVKLMWDLLLAGEGSAVLGTKGSTNKSSYRTRFEDTIGKRKAGTDVHKKQSLADIFHSMDEAEAEKTSHLEKEFHSKLKEKSPLNKGDNGKFDLSEAEQSEDYFRAVAELMALSKRMAFFTERPSDVEEEFRINNGDTYVVLARKIVEAVKELREAKKKTATESNQTRSQLNKMVHRDQTK